MEEGPSDRSKLFSVQVFQGFADGVSVDADPKQSPLSVDDFLAGLGEIVTCADTGDASIGGFDAVWYEIEIPEDSPYLCAGDQLSDVLAQERCVVFSNDGWRFIDDPPMTSATAATTSRNSARLSQCPASEPANPSWPTRHSSPCCQGWCFAIGRAWLFDVRS